MNIKRARLRLAALAGIACVCSVALANEVSTPSSIRLSWGVPTENVDGTPLTDLQAYYIYIGSTPETMLPIFSTNAVNTSIVLPYHCLSARYFAVTAVNANGVQSERTPMVSTPAQ